MKQRTLYQDRIVCSPEILAGKPVIKGTRIPVERIIAHLANRPDMADLFAAYPELTVEDVKASLDYAHTVLIKQQGGETKSFLRARSAHA